MSTRNVSLLLPQTQSRNVGMAELELNCGIRQHFLLAVTWEATQCDIS